MVNRELFTLAPEGFAPFAAGLFAAIAPRTVALAGGSTPPPVYRQLAALGCPWEQVDVFFGDERCVPPDHPDSNYRMARETLLDHVPARAHPMDGARCDADAYQRDLASVLGAAIPSFDLVFLGLGDDGHTASLFPGDRTGIDTTRTVVAVARPDHRRLSLTLPVLNAARTVVFLVSGASKRAALRDLLAGADIPAAKVSARRVIIVADTSAAPA
jgi:6-phosphogluconolactonase